MFEFNKAIIIIIMVTKMVHQKSIILQLRFLRDLISSILPDDVYCKTNENKLMEVMNKDVVETKSCAWNNIQLKSAWELH